MSATSSTNPLQQINDFRQKILKGEPVTEEELRDNIQRLANIRQGAASTIQVKEPKAPVDKKLSKEKAKSILGDLL